MLVLVVILRSDWCNNYPNPEAGRMDFLMQKNKIFPFNF